MIQPCLHIWQEQSYERHPERKVSGSFRRIQEIAKDSAQEHGTLHSYWAGAVRRTHGDTILSNPKTYISHEMHARQAHVHALHQGYPCADFSLKIVRELAIFTEKHLGGNRSYTTTQSAITHVLVQAIQSSHI
jgi:hypothetical protein